MTADKEGENSTFDRELETAEVIITTPYVPSPKQTMNRGLTI